MTSWPSPFPPEVAFAVVEGAPPTGFVLHADEERALSAAAVFERRRQFTLGRAAARAALAALGVEGAVPRADDGRPLWPRGIVGALTHTADFAAAAVVSARHALGVGVDVERLDRRLTHDIAPRVCLPTEIGWVRAGVGLERLLLLFAAKEAIFKATYPSECVWLGLQDAELRWEGEPPESTPAAHTLRGHFLAMLVKSAGTALPAGTELRVDVARARGLVLASLLIRP